MENFYTSFLSKNFIKIKCSSTNIKSGKRYDFEKWDLQNSKDLIEIVVGLFDLLPHCEVISQVRGHGKFLDRLDPVFPWFGKMITSWLSQNLVRESFALKAF